MKLKFKAWDRQVNRMCDVTRLEFGHQGSVVGIAVDNYEKGYGLFKNGELESRFELLQYTGLNDIDGKEIYQGYILERRNGQRYVVDFARLDNGTDGYSTAFYLQPTTGSQTPVTFEHSDRIVGNVFDNVELVGTDKPQIKLMSRVKERLATHSAAKGSTKK
ncbi:YopX family protein [uncultured Secundilactobacillus sp.]|uniref:YopX family protein n=1 Tax=uncultured Secundilactobacillus sp. TaxID=2813935 RepID=UPI00258B7FA5|nr:YopX family protein [uncultured Secundilactobacillus sp.]